MHSGDVVKIENLQASDAFIVRWQVTYLCNYQCAFCIQGDRETHLLQARGEDQAIRAQIAKRLVETLEGLSSYPAIRISLIGGEVTILKDFPNLLDTLTACKFKGHIQLSMTTNLSLPASYFCNLYDIVNSHNGEYGTRALSIGASFYKAYTTSEEFREKLHVIADHVAALNASTKLSLPKRAIGAFSRRLSKVIGRQRITFKVPTMAVSRLSAWYPMLDDEDYDDYLDASAEFANASVPFSPMIMRRYEANLSPETKAKILEGEKKDKLVRVTFKSGETMTLKNIQALGALLESDEMFHPRGFECDAGIDFITIDALGNVVRCPVLWDDPSMHLGSILDGSFHKLTESRVCLADHCSCTAYKLIQRVDDEQPTAQTS